LKMFYKKEKSAFRVRQITKVYFKTFQGVMTMMKCI